MKQCEIYEMVYIWCCYGNMLSSNLFLLQNQMLPFVAARGKI